MENNDRRCGGAPASDITDKFQMMPKYTRFGLHTASPFAAQGIDRLGRN
jgi:hypothetical protein